MNDAIVSHKNISTGIPMHMLSLGIKTSQQTHKKGTSWLLKYSVSTSIWSDLMSQWTEMKDLPLMSDVLLSSLSI